MPKRQRYLFVCTNRRDASNPKGSCAVSGSEGLLIALKAELNKRGLAGDVRACGSTCLDLCEHAASVVLEPDHIVYANVTLEDVPTMVDGLVEGKPMLPKRA
jgi:(2Fe-2S) ferredoxin